MYACTAQKRPWLKAVKELSRSYPDEDPSFRSTIGLRSPKHFQLDMIVLLIS